jgi:hypothetical protein
VYVEMSLHLHIVSIVISNLLALTLNCECLLNVLNSWFNAVKICYPFWFGYHFSYLRMLSDLFRAKLQEMPYPLFQPRKRSETLKRVRYGREMLPAVPYDVSRFGNTVRYGQ